MKKHRLVIEGYTSNQEIRASAWVSCGEAKVYQFACNLYEIKALAKRVYGKNCWRKVRITMEEITEKGDQ